MSLVDTVTGLFSKLKGSNRTTQSVAPDDPTPDSLTLRHSYTIDYGDDAWGIERIGLDGIQNHLPKDANAENFGASFLVGEEWVDFRRYSEGDVSAVKFWDDGEGYDYDSLTLNFSTKRGSEEAAGHHGEGLKMITLAYLREAREQGNPDMKIELRSNGYNGNRPWGAFGDIDEGVRVKDQTAQQLIYNVHFDVDLPEGSETILWAPPQELVDYISHLDDDVLDLREGYRPIFRAGPQSHIADTSGNAYIRGIKIKEIEDNLFGYLVDLRVPKGRDRDEIDSYYLNQQITKIWEAVDDPSVYVRLLQEIDKDPEGFSRSSEHSVLAGQGVLVKDSAQEVFKRAFYHHYGEDAVLLSDKRLGNVVEAAGYTPIWAESDIWRDTLRRTGIPTDFDTLGADQAYLYMGEDFDPDNVTEELDRTNFLMQYRDWAELRIVLDSVSNHLDAISESVPEDSRGSDVTIEALVEDRYRQEGDPPLKWMTFQGSYSRRDSEIRALRVSDDGSGYSNDKLVDLGSNKGEEAIGQFGEGLKLLSVAAARLGIPIKHRSQDWAAMPFVMADQSGEDQVERLAYRRATGLEPIGGSSTTIFEPNEAVREIFGDIGYYFLHFSDEVDEQHTTDDVDILTTYRGDPANQHRTIEAPAAYVKGVWFNDNTQGELKTIYSYNFRTDDIAPDRDNIDHSVFKRGILGALGTLDNYDTVHTLLARLKDEPDEEYVEFGKIELADDENTRQIWVDAFEHVFGQHTVIDGHNEAANYEAKHNGYEIVRIDHKIEDTLRQAGVKTTVDVMYSNVEEDLVEIEDLGATEQERLALMPHLDKIFGYTTPAKVEVFSEAREQDGTIIKNPAYIRGGTIYLHRDLLSGAEGDFIKSYHHERGHEVTEQPDPADEFRHHFEKFNVGYALAQLRQMREDSDYELVPMEVAPSEPFDYDLATKGLDAAAREHRKQAERIGAERAVLEETLVAELTEERDRYHRELGTAQSELRDTQRVLGAERMLTWYDHLINDVGNALRSMGRRNQS